jgi:hypothetical protein
MPMNPSTWGTSVANAVKAVGVTAGTPITDAQLEQIWRAIKTQDDAHISANAKVTVTVTGVQPGPSNLTAEGTVD